MTQQGYDVESITNLPNKDCEQLSHNLATGVVNLDTKIVLPTQDISNTERGNTQLLENNLSNNNLQIMDRMQKIMSCCIKCSVYTFSIIFLFALYYGFSISCIVVAMIDMNKNFMAFDNWPNPTAAQWLLVYGIFSFMNSLYRKKEEKNIIYLIVYSLIAFFSIIWIIVGMIPIFAHGYDEKYYSYSAYILISICSYVSIIIMSIVALYCFSLICIS